MELPKNWKTENNSLVRELTLSNFLEVVSLVNKIAQVAEKLNHHPDLDIYNYKNLRIKITTHDSGEITSKDYNLASEIEKLLLQ